MNKKQLSNLLIAASLLTAPASALAEAPAISTNRSLSQPAVITSSLKAYSDTVFFLLKAGLAVGGVVGLLTLFAAFLFRRVVSTNMVHIVQSGNTTTPFGANLPNGNVYYEIPTWVPRIGVSVIKLPVNNFDLSLEDYEAYDEDRVPFLVDVTAFFRIINPNVAAERISNFDELRYQLSLIVQGAVRRVLASEKIDNIMTQRSTFGDSFSNEVQDQLAEWGVGSVRNMELMDIRDSEKSSVIQNIMSKKISEIERDSRVTVSENNRLAKVAEEENRRTAEIATVEAQKEISISKEIANQEVGEKSADRERAVGVAQEQSLQIVLLEKAATKEKDLDILRIQEIRQAEIARDKSLVIAEQEQKVSAVNKETALVKASQDKETAILAAEGRLEAEKKDAEGIQAKGVAQAEAEKALQLAPVSAQIELAREIGSNEPYQKYLAILEALKAYIAVGSEQAKSLQGADVRVIANGGTATEGVSKIYDIFSSNGGTALAAAVEAFAQSDLGSELIGKLLSKE